MKRTLLSLTTAAALLTLAACGSGADTATSSTPAASSQAPATSPAQADNLPESSDEDDDAPEESDADLDDTSADDTDTDTDDTETEEPGDDETDAMVDTEPGAGAPVASGSGLVIPAGVGNDLPESVGGWSQSLGSTNVGAIYDKDGSSVIVAFLSGTGFTAMSASITDQVTPVAAGVCGSMMSPTNLTCVLETEDGVLSLSADAGDTPLETLAAFADEFASETGAA